MTLGQAAAPPLREEMAYLKVADAHPVAKVYPLPQPGKIKPVFSVFYGDIHQLCGGALTTDIGVKLGGEDRR